MLACLLCTCTLDVLASPLLLAFFSLLVPSLPLFSPPPLLMHVHLGCTVVFS
eukprot:m.160245 g.160245  ORF g.160245 m.160245 type:complete len:52 (-) comp16357_c1_seq1:3312-3467(-)